MKDYICSIDIGSSRCIVLVARPSGESLLEIIGVGSSVSQGVKDGVIVNIEAATRSVSEAAREAELMSGLVVDEALLNITGKHVKGENSRGVVAITNRDRLIGESDVYRVIEGAQNIRIPADQDIIHVLSREFHVDDQNGIRDPVGMTGVRLEAEVHIVTAGKTAILNLNKAVFAAQIKVSDVVMSSLASSEAVLTEEEKDLGVAVLDIGSRVTDIAIFVDGGVSFSTTVPLGGGHVTHDLSIGLKIPAESAEMIKRTYGVTRIGMIDPTEKIELSAVHGRPARWILRQEIAEIIEPRMREIFEMIDRELVRSGKKSSLAGGIVITGGGSLIEGTLSLAEEVIGLPVSQGFPQGISGFTELAGGSEFSTAVGLLHYYRRFAGMPHSEQKRSEGHGIFRKIKHWIRENL